MNDMEMFVEWIVANCDSNVVVVMFLVIKFQVGLLNLSQDISILDIEPISIDSLLDRLLWNKLIVH